MWKEDKERIELVVRQLNCLVVIAFARNSRQCSCCNSTKSDDFTLSIVFIMLSSCLIVLSLVSTLLTSESVTFLICLGQLVSFKSPEIITISPLIALKTMKKTPTWRHHKTLGRLQCKPVRGRLG